MSNIFGPFCRDQGIVLFNDGSGPVGTHNIFQSLKVNDLKEIFSNTGGDIDHYAHGLPFDVDGRLVVDTGAIAYYDQGLPFSADGRLIIAGDDIPVRYDQGVPFSADGGLSQSGGGAPTMVSVFQAASYTGTTRTSSSAAMRSYLPAALIADGIGGFIQVHFGASSNNIGNMPVSCCFIGHQVTNTYTFDGNQQRITFNGGSHSVLLTPGDEITSDIVPFAYDGTKNIILSVGHTGTLVGMKNGAGAGSFFHRENGSAAICGADTLTAVTSDSNQSGIYQIWSNI